MMNQDELQRDLALLTNYEKDSFTIRGVILKVLFHTLAQINSGSWFIKLVEDEKPKAKSAIQANIISQIVMYIEDAVVIAESFRSGRNFYEFLGNVQSQNEIDLGNIIKEFFTNLEKFSDEEICSIMSYVNPNKIDFGKDTELVKRHIETNIKEVRRIFKMLYDFSDTHHIVSKRLKHAGIPIILGLSTKTPGPNIFKNFDAMMLVAKGSDPTLDLVPIPYSNEVLDSYHIIINGLQTHIVDIIKNRLWCLGRNMERMIPAQSYAIHKFTFKENDRLREIVEEYLLKHPLLVSKVDVVNPKPRFTNEDVKWFLDLPKFMAECKERLSTFNKYESDYKEYSTKK